MKYSLIQDRLRLIELKAKLAATALDHPEHCVVTHCSMAVSENHGYVFIINSKQMLTRLFTFLVTTKAKQVLHNATFDFKYIYYYTQRFPQNYEEHCPVLAKCILNHVNTSLATVGLKELAGKWYGSWASSHLTASTYLSSTMKNSYSTQLQTLARPTNSGTAFSSTYNHAHRNRYRAQALICCHS